MEFKVNKKVINITKMGEEPNDRAFWMNQSWIYRLSALESLREQFYNYNYETAPRLQRVLTITQQA
ncbi:MAG: hypothetical protein R3E32_28800 [Chitinophagales bacterium]